ncbi:MAG TPA: hypothetical protein PKL17_15415 [Pseudomonadota bacterium]|nr:hypothetical protein [Pseudomonadota bacterium]HNF98845.1 hypothetical protein [Pseudomonadota bacterium]HNK46173.1 hypothetical protein [Pseudomonadota bacterium]HNN51677.1 hypothetical protein [Pseudomonadota bacterium]
MRRLGMREIALCCGLLWGAVAVIPSNASATVMTKLSLADMTARAEHVLLGRVEQIRSRMLPGHDGLIVTEVQIRCTRSIRGQKEGALVQVRHLGGSVGELGQKVFGEASYQVGEEVVLFLEPREGALYAVGMAQGKMHVDRSNGNARVSVDLGGAELIAPTGNDALPTAQGIALDALLGQLAELAQRIPAPSARIKSATGGSDGAKAGQKP